MNDVVKIKNVLKSFDLDLMRIGRKWEYELSKSGEIMTKYYYDKFRVPISKSISKQATEKDFAEMCEALLLCVNTADSLEDYTDDCCGEITIYHRYGRIEKVDRGCGNANTRAGEIINQYIDKFNKECRMRIMQDINSEILGDVLKSQQNGDDRT